MTTRTRSVCVADHEARRIAQGLPTLLVRPVKNPPRIIHVEHVGIPPDVTTLFAGWDDVRGAKRYLACPFGRVGDVVNIKEKYGVDTNGSRQWVVYFDMTHGPDCSDKISHDDAVKRGTPWNGFDWRSAATMPREFVRSRPVVAAIRVGRPCELTEEEAKLTGIESDMVDTGGSTPWDQWIEVPDWYTPFHDHFTKRYGPAAWERPAWLVTVGGKA